MREKHKNITAKAIIIFFLIAAATEISIAQWQGDSRLTINSNLSSTSLYGNSKSVAAEGNTVHVVWHDLRDGNAEIYYKKSTDEGTSWGADIRLTNNPSDSYDATVAVSGSLVFVAWYDKRDGHYEVYYKSSTDLGASWGPDTRLTNGIVNSLLPSAVVSGQNIYIVWYKQTGIGDHQIFFRRTTNGGINWDAEVQLTTAPNQKYDPTIAVSGSTVHVAWDDHRNAWPEIYYKHSTDGGLTWGTEVRLTPIDNLNSEIPSIGVSDSNVHIAWVDGRGTTGVDIYYIHSTNGGTSLGTEYPDSHRQREFIFPEPCSIGQ